MVKRQKTGRFPVKIEGVTYGLTYARHHGRRDDGVYVPILIDSMAKPDVAKKLAQAQREEADRLRTAGYSVLAQTTLYVFPHNYYSCRSRHGLLSTLPSEIIEQVVATFLAALDDAQFAEDCIQLLLVAPALAELGYGEVVDAPYGVEAIDIDLFWSWEQHAIDIARKEPYRVQQVFAALSLGDARNLAEITVLKKHMPDVIAAYQPKAEFSEFVWELLGGVPPASDSPWHLDRADRGVALCCCVPHETCPSDFDPWVSLGGNKLLAQIAERYPELKPEPISHEFPHYQGRYFCVGPDVTTGMILLGAAARDA